MFGPVKGKNYERDFTRVSEWNRLDPSEVIMNSNKALDYIDDLVESKMRDQWNKNITNQLIK